MFIFNILLTAIAVYFAIQEYNNARIGWAMFWAALVGWDIHTLIYTL